MWNVISKISRERKLSSVILTTHSMEEAEALATKMGIMVNGNLQCLGTSQHIKNKFGGGYEIEVKLDAPNESHVQAVLKSSEYNADTKLNRAEVEAMLEKAQLQDLKQELTTEGSGSAVFSELVKGTTSAKLVAEWIIMESDGIKLKTFLKQNFGEMTIIEHFQSFFRFRTESKIVIGQFFGALEDKKKELNVMQYSIRQTTIEQIFNTFAAEKPKLNTQAITANPQQQQLIQLPEVRVMA